MKRRLNVLWVVTTQWRASATGYAGDANARTPFLDALAVEAVDYTQAVTPHPFGPFARAALLTGVLSPENGVKDYYDPLPVEARTVAHEMSERGYATGFFGKWHLARRDPEAALVGEAHARMVVPEDSRGGFEFWEGFESGFLLNDPWLQGTRLAEPVKFTGYQSDVVCARVAEWLDERKEAKPWFCVVSLEAPHPPYDAPAAGVAVKRPEEILLSANVPRGGEVETKARRELAGYYAHIEATDRAIGRLFAGLKAGGVWDDTVVVFTSVHGDMHGAHGLFRKGWPQEDAVRVPLLVKSEGGRVKGERRSEAVSLAGLAGATVACAEGGVFELRAHGAGAMISMPSVVALPYQCDRLWRGVRTARRKLVLNADGSPWLFFDLENDPGEMRNLVGDAAWAEEIRAMMREV
jgi:arylsulfatase A-like enzyme